jgi:branched-chain amino acid transport system ATP-binding protein
VRPTRVPSMLEIGGLAVRFGSIAALRGVSLEVGAGEVVGLIGPNGAGKTTMLAAITGQVAPTDGRINFEGEPLLGRAPDDIVRMGISLVPEGRDIFGSLSVAENIRLGATIRRDREVDADRERMLDRFPVLRKYLHRPAAQLSGGEQQQLAIVRALMSRPRLLLLDEPSLGLAPLVIDLVFDEIARLRDEGVTVLLVEQNAARTIAFADRSYVLRSGTVVAAGRPEELATTADLADLYLGT